MAPHTILTSCSPHLWPIDERWHRFSLSIRLQYENLLLAWTAADLELTQRLDNGVDEAKARG